MRGLLESLKKGVNWVLVVGIEQRRSRGSEEGLRFCRRGLFYEVRV